MNTSSKSGAGEVRPRINVRMGGDTMARVGYWADKRDVSVNEYICDAVAEKIARENGDYDLPTLEMARLAQLVDEMKTLSVTLANIERITLAGFDSLIGLTRGDNYLVSPEDGEMPATAGGASGLVEVSQR